MSKVEYGTRKKYHFIYKTTNILTGRYYIGMHSTKDLNDGYLGSGKRLKHSINKYGKENHRIEILEFFENREELAKRESEIITLDEIAKKECMNLKPGGTGGFVNKIHAYKFHAAGGRAVRIMFGKIHNEKMKTDLVYRESIIAKLKGNKNFLGKSHSEETKRKMSLAKKGKGVGKNNSQYGTCWITNGIENKKIRKNDQIPENWKLGRKL